MMTYSGYDFDSYKDKKALRKCIDALIEHKAVVDKYDVLDDIIYINILWSFFPEGAALEIKKAFIKVGYSNVRVKYKSKKYPELNWPQIERGYRKQYKEITEGGYPRPPIVSFLCEYL